MIGREWGVIFFFRVGGRVSDDSDDLTGTDFQSPSGS
jgi:hypothetical protein